MINKINVVSLTDDMGIGGTARQIITIDKYLNKDFFNHYIISLSVEDNARSKFVDSQKMFFMSDPKEIADFIIKNNINILYFHRHGRNEVAHDRIIKKINNRVSVLEVNTFSAKDEGVFGRRCDGHVFVSQTNVLKYCVQNNLKFDFKKHKVVYGLIDTNNFTNKLPTDLELEDYRNKMGIKGYPVIGRISRPVMEKWDDEMLIMWNKLGKINPKIKFLAYGVPESRKQLFLTSGNKENLKMLEPTVSDKELGLFYSAIDILIHDSQIGECNCGTIAEAMLFKKPVVIRSTPFPKYVFGRKHTRDNGQIEQIKNDENGYVVTNGSAMAHAVADLVQKPELIKAMGQKNYDEISTKYDVSVGIKTLEKIFIESVLNKNSDLSAQIINYYHSLCFFPDEKDVQNWFGQYYFRLEDIYGKEYHNFTSERILLLYLKYKRKARTLLKRMGL